MSGFVYYHKDCFNRKKQRFFSKNIKSLILAIATDSPTLSEIEKTKLQYPKRFAENIDWLNPYYFIKPEQSNEETLNKLSDIEIFCYRNKIHWNYFSTVYSYQDPEQFWKFAPYINWEIFSKRNDLTEELILNFSHSIQFHMVRTKHLTKTIMRKFHDKLDWNHAAHSPFFDKEIFRKFGKQYRINQARVLMQLSFSEYEINQFIEEEFFSWDHLLTYAKLSQKQIRKIPKTELSKGRINLYLHRQQFSSDVLEKNLENINWDLVIKHQTTLTEKFIMKYVDNLKTPKRLKKGIKQSDASIKYTLTKVLRSNGLASKTNRTKAFNSFLFDKNLL